MLHQSLRMAVGLCMLFVLLPSAGAVGQEAKMVVKTYLVYDLISSIPNHRFDSNRLPSTERADASTSPFFDTSSVVGFMGGMGGPAGGAGGGGYFSVPSLGQMGGDAGGSGMGGMGGMGMGGMGGVVGRAATDRNLLEITPDDLIGLITSTVGPETWDEVGGPGSIEIVGGMLVVRNDDSVQAQIAQVLDSLREIEERGRLVTLHARLLRLTVAQLEDLTDANTPGVVKPEVLSELSKTPSLAYCGQLSCLNGQTSFVVLGERSTVVAGSVPVVGGQATGYHVKTAAPNSGALIEVTPLVLPGGERAIVDVHAVITAMLESQPLVAGVAPFDRVQIKAAQLGTTVRVNLGQPFLVGGLTDTHALSDDDKLEDQQQFYLVLKVD